ncbi:MAG: hypothetical protein H3C35_12765, partial [Bacteroidetes bacterium]|nr:hypothetical protein [Bacteroidota bacterium]
EKLEGHEGTKQKPEKAPKQPRVKVKVPEELREERTAQKIEAEKTEPVMETPPAEEKSIEENYDAAAVREELETEEKQEVSEEVLPQEEVTAAKTETAEAEVQIVETADEENLETIEEEIAAQFEHQTIKIFGARGLEGESALDREDNLKQNIPQSPSEENESGWSKWKSKVKTFFRKLFG